MPEKFKFLSACSGIAGEAFAWKLFGWQCVAFSEIDPDPCAVLAHHYPQTPNYGDFSEIEFIGEKNETIDVLFAGTPSQSFSIAGNRDGLDDDRRNLSIEFCNLLDRVNSRWFVWENVPIVLSVDDGKEFKHIIGKMAESGYSVACRILDAQFTRKCDHPLAVPQRRRVFVVGHFGDDWRSPL